MVAQVSEPLALHLPPSTHHWFSGTGVVVEDGDRRLVYVGGTLIGSFGLRERMKRNAILMGLLENDESIWIGKLCAAFSLSREGLRAMQKQLRTEGLAAVLARRPGGRGEGKTSAARVRRLEAMFEEGLSIVDAQKKLGKIGRSTVGFIHKAWVDRGGAMVPATVSPEPEPSTSLPLLPVPVESSVKASPMATEPVARKESVEPEAREAVPEAEGAAIPSKVGSDDEGCVSDDRPITTRAPTTTRWVQHLGTWLLVAMLGRAGLHRHAEAAGDHRVEGDALRVALDAVAMALAIGQKCVEGVRRIATPSASSLLRTSHPPSASWCRRVLGRLAMKLGGARMHLAMAKETIDAERVEGERVVFYVDNHLRPYTGKHTVRRGWRMQDKRVRPGISDYYVHDEDGRAVMRLAVASHGSLTEWLPPIARTLREAIGKGTRIVFAFDRAGAFPEHVALLRDQGFELVTYERRPYQTLPASEFTGTIRDEDAEIGVADSRINLGRGRGRVRRIALRVEDGRQVNLLAVSDLDAAELYRILRNRWGSQENVFKHGVERWGQNQLDGRKVEPYPPETIIPNPARRRLDRALRIARVLEGDARRELARLDDQAPQRARERWDRQLADALATQSELEAMRPATPKHVPLAETDLADKLVKLPDDYKMVVDTIRMACANAETDLAILLAPHLSIPAEAKRALANIFAAPGSVHVGDERITVALQPAGTKSELRAFGAFLGRCNRMRLALPGDAKHRPLRFRLQLS
ncbi:MAG: putative transposase [Solirubrobacteraceae bacterium]